MARTKNSFADVTRRRLLGAAGPLFAAHGLEGVSVRDIARVANVTGATVLHHFGSKERLYETCIEEMYAALAIARGRVVEAIASAPDLDGAIEAGVRTVFSIARANQVAIKLLLRQVADTGEIGDARREKQLLPFLEAGAALFAERTGRAPAELRLTLQSLIYLIGRWAVTSPREASAVAGVRGAAAFTAIENHLVDVARRQLSPASGEAPAHRRKQRRDT